LTAWDTWLSSHFSPTQLADPEITGPARDADGDGLSNLAEYALGGNPASASDCPKPEFSIPEPLLLRMSFRRESPDVTYIVEQSENLTRWDPLHAKLGNVGETVIVEIPTSGDRRFLRLRLVK
jgi:hypothetical protein